jgi:hypothetical protein
MAEYGKRNDLKRRANLSSALGAGDRIYYADKKSPDYRPTLFLVACVHGGEFEGTSALINFMSILETGNDTQGHAYPSLAALAEQINIMIILCANPDGRARIPFDTYVGRTFHDLRYYCQGTWKDGSLCGWPGCKKIHPIKDHVDFLGGYFNDEGINPMDDNFFGKLAPETSAVLNIADTYAPDFTALLHGGGNAPHFMLSPTYSPVWIKDEIAGLEERVALHCERKGLRLYKRPYDSGENKNPPSPFDLASAIYHTCGSPCITYESNQGLSNTKKGEIIEQDYEQTYAKIYQHHLILFEELCGIVLKQ